jgi:hypothetical protein
MTSQYSAVHSVLGLAFRDAGWRQGRESELDQLTNKLIRIGFGALDFAGVGSLMSRGFLRANGATVDLANRVVSSRSEDLARALGSPSDETGVTPAVTFGDLHLTVNGGNVAVGNRDVHQETHYVVKVGQIQTLRQALSDYGVRSEDVDELVSAVEAVQDAVARQAELSSPQSSIRRIGAKIADAYLATVVSAPVAVVIEVVAGMVGHYWGLIN